MVVYVLSQIFLLDILEVIHTFGIIKLKHSKILCAFFENVCNKVHCPSLWKGSLMNFNLTRYIVRLLNHSQASPQLPTPSRVSWLKSPKRILFCSFNTYSSFFFSSLDQIPKPIITPLKKEHWVWVFSRLVYHHTLKLQSDSNDLHVCPQHLCLVLSPTCPLSSIPYKWWQVGGHRNEVWVVGHIVGVQL